MVAPCSVRGMFFWASAKVGIGGTWDFEKAAFMPILLHLGFVVFDRFQDVYC
jgi:hypothetical protein